LNFIDIQAQYQYLKAELDAGVAAVLKHGQFIMGPEVAEFEQELADFIGVKNCISCANGTDALQMLYMAYGIGVGDAVFCPNITFIATIESACMLGATPVFCDITLDTYSLCPESLELQIKAVLAEGRLTPKIVIAVDFLGNPANYQALDEVCKKYGLLLIEDAAQSMGAIYQGQACGSLGDSASTSFFPAKPLGCYGDGGAILTNDDNIADICRSLRVHGKGPLGKYHNVRVGVNSRLDTLQAAILLSKLNVLKTHEITARQTVADYYNNAFTGHFVTPYVAEGTKSIYAQYALLASDEPQRDAILEKLKKAGIPSMVYYPAPLHTLEVFRNVSHYDERFLNALEYCRRTFSLPMHPYLTKEDQCKVIDCVLTLLAAPSFV
jgi:dTDP-4-amino-4,6-dideoxygalactose transaminase